MTAPRTDVRDRFLAAIAARLPAVRIVEVHLFQPIKQGGTESGVAVVALDEAAEHQSAGTAAEYRSERLAVFTARYRLTEKGPDRGKWDFSVQVEADAPLVTVETVVRGVQRRSGDAEEPMRLTGDEFRAALPADEPAGESA